MTENAREDSCPNMDDKEIVMPFAEKINLTHSVVDDDSLKERSKLYTNILEEYRNSLHCSFRTKNTLKIIAFFVSMAILLGITVAVVFLLFSYSSLEMMEWLAAIIPLMISFLTVFIVIPRIMTEYLFDKDEENHLLELLKAIMEHDKS